MAKAVHSMIRVLDEARSVGFYRDAFGLEVADRFDFDDFTLVYLRNPEADFEIELTVNKGRTEPYALGDGYGHLAVVVDDLDAEHARFDGGGARAAQARRVRAATARCSRGSSSSPIRTATRSRCCSGTAATDNGAGLQPAAAPASRGGKHDRED